MTAATRDTDRLDQLLADEATQGLGPGEYRELEMLLGRATDVGRDDYMQVASLVQVSFLHADRTGAHRMPEHLRNRLVRQGDELPSARPRGAAPVADLAAARARKAPVAGTVPDSGQIEVRRTTWRAAGLAGWLAAAALAVALVLPRLDSSSGLGDAGPSPADARVALLADAGDSITLPWQPAEGPGGLAGVSGDVVWSQQRQEGYLRIAGLPANDPTAAQYQLWIIDPERDSNPIDGGVFDVPAGGEVVIPIDAKLPVLGAKAFAITRERPGGVVVSAGPLLIVASA